MVNDYVYIWCATSVWSIFNSDLNPNDNNKQTNKQRKTKTEKKTTRINRNRYISIGNGERTNERTNTVLFNMYVMCFLSYVFFFTFESTKEWNEF